MRPFVKVSANPPETPEGAPQAEDLLVETLLQTPTQRAADVVVLLGQAGNPFDLLGSAETLLRAFDEAEAPIEMSRPRCAGLGSLLELLQCVLANRFEESVARLVTILIHEHERVTHKTRQNVHSIERLRLAVGANEFDGLERKPAGKHAEAAEHPLLPLVKTLIAPIDGCPKRL